MTKETFEKWAKQTALDLWREKVGPAYIEDQLREAHSMGLERGIDKKCCAHCRCTCADCGHVEDT